MYKVVIIDDEPIIVEGLSRLLPWEQYHCSIAATACNGKEGLEVIRRERPDILFSDICMPGLEEALKTMTERLSKKAITGEEAAEESLAAGNFVVKNALQYIEEHYNEKITLTQVAEMTYVSQWHLSKLLNKEEGKNFSEILNCIRVRHAKELLKDPAYRIADVAEMVGFTDVAHFSRVFKKTEGISANEYRNTKL